MIDQLLLRRVEHLEREFTPLAHLLNYKDKLREGLGNVKAAILDGETLSDIERLTILGLQKLLLDLKATEAGDNEFQVKGFN